MWWKNFSENIRGFFKCMKKSWKNIGVFLFFFKKSYQHNREGAMVLQKIASLQ
jgi:hypothetical protein